MNEECDVMTNPVKMEISEVGKVSDLQDRMKRLLQYITTDSESGLEACSFCLKVYQGPQPSIRQRKLMDHIDSVHLKIRSFKCQFCDKTYPSKSQLCTHLKLKHSEEIVSKQFLERSESSSSLDAKFKKNPERLVICEVCPILELSTLKAVIAHRREKHTDGKLYYCPHCQARKKLRNDLKIHSHTHCILKGKNQHVYVLNQWKPIGCF